MLTIEMMEKNSYFKVDGYGVININDEDIDFVVFYDNPHNDKKFLFNHKLLNVKELQTAVTDKHSDKAFRYADGWSKTNAPEMAELFEYIHPEKNGIADPIVGMFKVLSMLSERGTRMHVASDLTATMIPLWDHVKGIVKITSRTVFTCAPIVITTHYSDELELYLIHDKLLSLDAAVDLLSTDRKGVGVRESSEEFLINMATDQVLIDATPMAGLVGQDGFIYMEFTRDNYDGSITYEEFFSGLKQRDDSDRGIQLDQRVDKSGLSNSEENQHRKRSDNREGTPYMTQPLVHMKEMVLKSHRKHSEPDKDNVFAVALTEANPRRVYGVCTTVILVIDENERALFRAPLERITYVEHIDEPARNSLRVGDTEFVLVERDHTIDNIIISDRSLATPHNNTTGKHMGWVQHHEHASYNHFNRNEFNHAGFIPSDGYEHNTGGHNTYYGERYGRTGPESNPIRHMEPMAHGHQTMVSISSLIHQLNMALRTVSMIPPHLRTTIDHDLIASIGGSLELANKQIQRHQ